MSFFPVAKIGDRDKAEVEYAKVCFGFVDDSGVFTADLAARVRGFQLSHNLRATGYLDADTLAKLGWTGARLSRERTDEVLADHSLDFPLSEEDYRRASFDARRSGGSEAVAQLARGQRAAKARAAAARARQPRK